MVMHEQLVACSMALTIFCNLIASTKKITLEIVSGMDVSDVSKEGRNAFHESYIIEQLSIPRFQIFELASKKLQIKCVFEHFFKMATIRLMRFS